MELGKWKTHVYGCVTPISLNIEIEGGVRRNGSVRCAVGTIGLGALQAATLWRVQDTWTEMREPSSRNF